MQDEHRVPKVAPIARVSWPTSSDRELGTGTALLIALQILPDQARASQKKAIRAKLRTEANQRRGARWLLHLLSRQRLLQAAHLMTLWCVAPTAGRPNAIK